MNTSYDWKKHAAAVMADDDVERAFADQAFGMVGARASKLFQAPYFLGFEMVFANEDKTRLVGIFAFRANDELLYAPVFFLNGQIKGQELLYRVKQKMFVPLSEEWVTYLLEKDTPDPGMPVKRNRIDRLMTGTDMTPLIFPRRVKSGHAHVQEKFFDGHLDDFCPKSASLAPIGLLKQFLLENGVKYANAVAEAVKSSHTFAEALMRMCDGEIEEALPSEAFRITKTASAPVPPKLAFHFGGVKNANIKTQEAFGQTLKFGFTVEDNRTPDETSTVYEDNATWESVGHPGLYELPLTDGGTGKAIVAPQKYLSGISTDSNGYGAPVCCGSSSCDSNLAVLFLDPRKTVQRLPREKVLGRAVPEGDPKSVTADLGKEGCSEGKAYVVFDSTTGAISEPFWVLAKRERDGGTTALVITTIDRGNISKYSVREVLLNPDAPECDFDAGILDGEARFVELDTEEIQQAPNDVNYNSGATSFSVYDTNKTVPARRLVAPPTIMPSALTVEALMTAGMRYAKVKLRDGDKKLMVEVTGAKLASFFNPASAVAFLTSRAQMPGEAALEIVKTAFTRGECRVVFAPAVKSASAVTRIVDRADFTPDYDAYFGTVQESPKSYALATETDQPPIRDIPVNEVYDPALGGRGNEDRGDGTGADTDHLSQSDLLTKDPKQLAQLQKMQNLPYAFEHGVVGSLVKTFDAAQQVEKYVPALETALDRLGRLVFLVYWKPQDLEKAYGSDDMADLEAEIVSNFKSYGTLVLNLLKRSKNNTQGAPALS